MKFFFKLHSPLKILIKAETVAVLHKSPACSELPVLQGNYVVPSSHVLLLKPQQSAHGIMSCALLAFLSRACHVQSGRDTVPDTFM